MEYLALMEDRWAVRRKVAAGCRQIRATSTRSRARTSCQFPNAKCEQAWHICQFFPYFCQVNKIAKSKCQTVG